MERGSKFVISKEKTWLSLIVKRNSSCKGFGKGDQKANIRSIEVDLDYAIGFFIYFLFFV